MGKPRPVRTVTCPSCQATRETRVYGGIPIKCSGCGGYFEVPRMTKAKPAPPAPAPDPQPDPEPEPVGAAAPAGGRKPRFSSPPQAPPAVESGQEEAPPPAKPTRRRGRFGPRR